MLSKPSLSGLLCPIIIPIAFFLGTYFLFPEFAYNFYGTSFKHRNTKLQREVSRNVDKRSDTDSSDVLSEKQNTAQTQNNEQTAYDIEKDVERLKNITQTVVDTATSGVATGIKTIKNVFEYPSDSGSSKDVINRYKQMTPQDIR